MSDHNENEQNHTQRMLAQDDTPSVSEVRNTIGEVINRRFNRRETLGILGTTAITALVAGCGFSADEHPSQQPSDKFDFSELQSGIDEKHHVAEGYDADVLLRWGDPIFKYSPAFDPENQTAAAQLTQFGYNNDFLGFIPLNKDSTRGLLCVNHEYTNEELMFPALGKQDNKGFSAMTKELVEVEMAAHGGTVIEIARKEGKWAPVLTSKYNRRISPLNTPMDIDGPAAGDALMQTKEDPTGTKVKGTINNCAGGITPWGTYLMAEENIRYYFYTDQVNERGKPKKDLVVKDKKKLKRYGVPSQGYAWGRYYDRFNIDKEPHECNRFGWIVEVDPLKPNSTPVKHTALGRFQHEGCEPVLNKDGHVVVYSGDDNRFDYVYKFVSKGKYDKKNRSANLKLLSEGTLYVAKFNDDGTLNWMPLIHGKGPLTTKNGFASQAEVLIHARLAADKLGATPMDRPEDIEPVGDGRVYVMLTNNSKRKETNTANPRAKNNFGHVIEIIEPNADHTSTTSKWEILIKCGNPKVAEVGAMWNPKTSEHGWFGSPDNCTIDEENRLWISTDQGSKWSKTGKSDGLYAISTKGADRGTSKLFFRTPVGAELCGPCFSDPDNLFVAVQHPAADGAQNFKPFGRKSTYEDPVTRWPDFNEKMPPRPSVVSIRKKGGGKIG